MSNSKPAANAKPSVETPAIKRRLVCLVYDTFLVAAVLMLGMLVYVLLFKSMSDTFNAWGRPIALVLVTGAYFLHTWTGSGHTLAMKTWRIKLVKVGMARVPLSAAIVRYVAAWGWVLPGLVVSWLLHLPAKQIAIAVSANVVLWALLALLDKDRQFLHDRIAGTRLIALPKLPKGALIT